MHGVQNTEKKLRHSCKGRCADIWRRPGAKHCSSLCSQSEGDEYCGGQARAENPTKSCPRALVMFATCSWPSLCEQSELQCWRHNRRLCGPDKSRTCFHNKSIGYSVSLSLPYCRHTKTPRRHSLSRGCRVGSFSEYGRKGAPRSHVESF